VLSHGLLPLDEITLGGVHFMAALQEIVITSTVKEIDDSIIKSNSNLTNVEYCDEIEEFVSCEAGDARVVESGSY
jgi:hypothetical protein